MDKKCKIENNKIDSLPNTDGFESIDSGVVANLQPERDSQSS